MIRAASRLHLVAAVLWFCLGLAGGAAAQQGQVSVFGGISVSNVWEDTILDPTGLDWRDTGLVGVAFGRDWRRGAAPVSFGLEFQVVKYAGEQDHFEFNLPVFVRYHPSSRLPVRSLGFGLGLSHATDAPEVEVLTKGSTERTLFYWTAEAEFGPRGGAVSIFTRLHHRSNGFGLLADEGGSNVIVWGLRRRW